jgi:hypothetical protein
MFEGDFWGEIAVTFSHGLGRKATRDFTDPDPIK